MNGANRRNILQPSLTTPITKLLLFRTTTQLYTTKSSRCDITQASRDFTKTNQFLDQSATLSITRIIITFQWPSYSALYALQQSSTQNLSCHCQCVLYYAPKTSHPSKNLKLLYWIVVHQHTGRGHPASFAHGLCLHIKPLSTLHHKFCHLYKASCFRNQNQYTRQFSPSSITQLSFNQNFWRWLHVLQSPMTSTCTNIEQFTITSLPTHFESNEMKFLPGTPCITYMEVYTQLSTITMVFRQKSTKP